MSAEQPVGPHHRLESASPSAAPPRAARGRRVLLGLALLALLAAAVWAGHWWLVGRFIETTDDAYLQADSLTIAPKISGYVAEVLVADNQAVHAGDLLARLDARKYHAALDERQATVAARQADVARAEAELTQQQASIGESQAQLAGAQADLHHARAQVERYAPLTRSGAETEERLAELNNEQARAVTSVAARQAALRSAQARIGTLQAQLKQARAQLAVAAASGEQSGLDLADAELRSPVEGRVADRAVRVGQFAQPGTRLMTIVPLQALYLTANFKETQVGQMRPGQTVVVHVDALPGQALQGHVDSLAPGTGAQFALLPASNATGNFTKIVQRVPVRIQLEIPDALRDVLVPGLSATVDVDLRSGARHG
ncbi:HlyD family secretion protein [Pseudomonas sp. RIT-PI-S]|uniref:HlyD family secretion protein n=1 Tax=Pseudomonas sp. RIT-PI-S TaxID=3035295 RepID=UPI0021D96B06|nr:HlyD family secretion protein [Pseudomonas sp. RIT-PI-S]